MFFENRQSFTRMNESDGHHCIQWFWAVVMDRNDAPTISPDRVDLGGKTME
jgi:hypothetical protein